MSSADLYVAKAANDELLQWVTHEKALKTAIVKILGVVVRQIMQHPLHGFTLMSIREILAKVRTKFGRMRTDTRKSLNERMTTRLEATENYDTHVSNLRQLFSISTVGGHLVHLILPRRPSPELTPCLADIEAENKKLKAAQGDRKRRDYKGKQGQGQGKPEKAKEKSCERRQRQVQG
jgi:hypothetical protein